MVILKIKAVELEIMTVQEEKLFNLTLYSSVM